MMMVTMVMVMVMVVMVMVTIIVMVVMMLMMKQIASAKSSFRGPELDWRTPTDYQEHDHLMNEHRQHDHLHHWCGIISSCLS